VLSSSYVFACRPHLSNSTPHSLQVPPPHKVCRVFFGFRIFGRGAPQIGHIIKLRLIPHLFFVIVPIITSATPIPSSPKITRAEIRVNLLAAPPAFIIDGANGYGQLPMILKSVVRNNQSTDNPAHNTSCYLPHNPMPVHPVSPENQQPLRLSNPGQRRGVRWRRSEQIGEINEHQENY
jgi:hypothetical protein